MNDMDYDYYHPTACKDCNLALADCELCQVDRIANSQAPTGKGGGGGQDTGRLIEVNGGVQDG